jgi:hypothetical protein
MAVGSAFIAGAPVGLILSVVVVACAMAPALPRTLIAAAANRALRMFAS